MGMWSISSGRYCFLIACCFDTFLGGLPDMSETLSQLGQRWHQQAVYPYSQVDHYRLSPAIIGKKI